MHYADCDCPGPHSEESMSDILIVTSKIKSLVKEKVGFRTGEDFIEKLSAEVKCIVEEAIISAQRAGRKTLKAEDLEPLL